MQRRRRVCGTKVKTGCQTCKIRRVKCDETKPACKRCTSTGRSCDGYIENVLTSVIEYCTAKRFVHSFPTTIRGSREEKRGFQYFVECTAPQLSGYYSSSFWETLILQASATELCLRHAVIAIGALHEEFADASSSQDTTLADSSQTSSISAFATSQYTKAIQHLRQSLSLPRNMHDQQSLLTALLCSLLFISFDSLRSHFHTAMMHFRFGLRILHSLCYPPTSTPTPLSPSTSHLLTSTLTPFFTRLTIQAILYIDTRSSPEQHAFATDLATYRIPSPFPSSLSSTSSSTFTTLDEARTALNSAINGIFHMSYLCDGELPMASQPTTILSMHARYSKELSRWGENFAVFLNSPLGKALSKREVRGAAILKMQHLTVTIMASCIPAEDDERELGTAAHANAAEEKFLALYRNVIKLARGVVEAEKEETMVCRSGGNGAGIKRGGNVTFSTDLGIIGPLYYAAANCGDKGLRSEAVELILLGGRKREGMWDSGAVGNMVRELNEIERTLDKVDTGGLQDGSWKIGFDVIVHDGMRWEWRLRGKLLEVQRYGGDDGVTLFVDGKVLVMGQGEGERQSSVDGV